MDTIQRVQMMFIHGDEEESNINQMIGIGKRSNFL